jgi:toxin ParE1/3/4
VAQIRYTARAVQDLRDLWLTIATEDPGAADRILDRLAKRAATLSAYPLAGRARPDIAPEARMVVEPPYLLLYRRISDGIQIVRVLMVPGT